MRVGDIREDRQVTLGDGLNLHLSSNLFLNLHLKIDLASQLKVLLHVSKDPDSKDVFELAVLNL